MQAIKIRRIRLLTEVGNNGQVSPNVPESSLISKNNKKSFSSHLHLYGAERLVRELALVVHRQPFPDELDGLGNVPPRLQGDEGAVDVQVGVARVHGLGADVQLLRPVEPGLGICGK